jgi:hypothetical protein
MYLTFHSFLDPCTKEICGRRVGESGFSRERIFQGFGCSFREMD